MTSRCHSRSPPGFPDDWVESDSTAGNSVIAHLDTSGPALRGNRNGQLTFDPADPDGDEQRILNLFYVSCFLHDYFYLLGFREADGNFQHDNLGRGGLATDRVEARAHRGAVYGTANMYTPVEGSGPVMSMGLVTSTNRHTALDATVVIHEFTHGVSNRLVGGADERPGSGRSSEPRLRGGLQRLLRLHDHRKHGRRVMGGTSTRRPARICIRLELP